MTSRVCDHVQTPTHSVVFQAAHTDSEDIISSDPGGIMKLLFLCLLHVISGGNVLFILCIELPALLFVLKETLTL